MKKCISVLLTITLILALGVSVFAENGIEGKKSSSIEIKYSTVQNYVVEIPSAVSFSNGDSSATISAFDVLLEDGYELRVSMTSDNNFNLENRSSSIQYKVSGDTDGLVLKVSAGSTSGSNTLEFSLVDASKATLAGEHKDVLSFECGVFSAEEEIEETADETTDSKQEESSSTVQDTTTETTSDENESPSGTGSNSSNGQNPTLGADEGGQAGAAGAGGGQELGQQGEDPRPTPSDPEPEPEPQPEPPQPYQRQTY